MATDYYMGKGMMMNYGETYEMKKEELVKVLDEYVEALRRVEAERDVLQKEILRLKYHDADPFELDLLNKT
jgi:hypothetical protein